MGHRVNKAILNAIVYDRAGMSQTPVPLIATSSQTVGPFFHFGLADHATLGCLVRPDTRGERIRLRIRVFDGDGAPLPDALVELWQADADGVYIRRMSRRTCSRRPASVDSAACQRARTVRVCSRRSDPVKHVTRKAGRRRRTSTSASSPGASPPGVHANLFRGDAALESDAVLALVPEDRRQTLLARPRESGEWLFDVRLQGDGETVFFDL